jgi:hypothetical protein
MKSKTAIVASRLSVVFMVGYCNWRDTVLVKSLMDETKLLDANEGELLDVIRTHSPTNPLWEGAKAALEIKNTRRILASTKRMERATYVILVVMLVQLALVLIPWVRGYGR